MIKELDVALKLISRINYLPSDEEFYALGYSVAELNEFDKRGYYPSDDELKYVAEQILMKYFMTSME